MSNQKLNLKVTNLARMNAIWRSLFVFSVFLFSITSCKHDPNIPLIVKLPIDQPMGGTGECDPDSIYFEKDVLPIILGSCVAGCHDEVTASEGVVLTSYSRIMSTADVRSGNANNSKLYEVLVDSDVNDRMPPAPASALNSDQIDAIRRWINQGALNNTCNFDTVAVNCDQTGVSFLNNVTPIFSSYGCISCHSGGPVILNTYAGTKIVADNSKLMGSINHDSGFQSMPQGSAKMDSCEIKVIQTWITEGTLDN